MCATPHNGGVLLYSGSLSERKKRIEFQVLFCCKEIFRKSKKKMSAKCVDIFFAVVMFSIVVVLLFAPY